MRMVLQSGAWDLYPLLMSARYYHTLWISLMPFWCCGVLDQYPGKQQVTYLSLPLIRFQNHSMIVLLDVYKRLKSMDRQLWDILHCTCTEHNMGFRWNLNESFHANLR